MTVEKAGATAISVDRYADKPAALRFVQAMSGLHYGEWGGAGMRLLYVAAGLATVVLVASGIVMWLRMCVSVQTTGLRESHAASWIPRRRRPIS